MHPVIKLLGPKRNRGTDHGFLLEKTVVCPLFISNREE